MQAPTKTDDFGSVKANVQSQQAQRNVHGDLARPDLDKFAYEHHWQRPDGSVYLVDSSD